MICEPWLYYKECEAKKKKIWSKEKVYMLVFRGDEIVTMQWGSKVTVEVKAWRKLLFVIGLL